MALPRAARQFVELLPIAFVPRRHCLLYYVLCFRLDARCDQKVRIMFLGHRSSPRSREPQILRSVANRQALNILHIRHRVSFSLSIVSNTLPPDLFRWLLSQPKKKSISAANYSRGQPVCAGILYATANAG